MKWTLAALGMVAMQALWVASMQAAIWTYINSRLLAALAGAQ